MERPHTAVPVTLLHELLQANAERHPDRPAVWHQERWWSYGQLQTWTDQVMGMLQGFSLEPGERVALLLENSPAYIASLFGALKAGLVEVSLNHELSPPALAELLRHSGARALLAAARSPKVWLSALHDLPDLRHLVLEGELAPGIRAQLPTHLQVVKLPGPEPLPASRQGPPASPRRTPQDLASIIYTSGSTGRPKGVMLSHRNFLSNTTAIVDYLGLQPDDRMLVVLPFHYVYGRSLLYSHFMSGGTLVLENRFAYPAVVLDTLERTQATALAGVPSTFSILLRKTQVRERRFPHLRFLTQAGGGMAPALQQEVAEVFAPAALWVMYGATEASPRLSYVPPAMLPRKWGSIGRPVPGVELIVADARGNALPVGAIGELAARGPNIMLGYWQDPEATAEVLRLGYYFTGDLGYQDADGYFYLTGRAREMVKVGGNRVNPKEVEETMLELPGVLEVAVLGEPDEMLGEAIRAFVVRSDALLTEEALRSHLRRRLPTFKQPKWIEFRSGLPKNASGKILKHRLADEG